MHAKKGQPQGPGWPNSLKIWVRILNPMLVVTQLHPSAILRLRCTRMLGAGSACCFIAPLSRVHLPDTGRGWGVVHCNGPIISRGISLVSARARGFTRYPGQAAFQIVMLVRRRRIGGAVGVYLHGGSVQADGLRLCRCTSQQIAMNSKQVWHCSYPWL